MSPEFLFENDLLKHYVRTEGWLPACRARLAKIRSSKARRLRYFTFCAIGAIDVLMLDVAKVIRRSNGRFDTVVFFDRTREDVLETQKRIPGAIGFPGDFLTTVLLSDPEEGVVAEFTPVENLEASKVLDSDQATNDTREVRDRQQLLYDRKLFMQEFPFDVVNLDLETFLFKPNDRMPGRVVRALRQILDWQKRQRVYEKDRSAKGITEFSLMFTTQIGPPKLSNDYLELLSNSIGDNLARFPHLGPIFNHRSAGRTIEQLQRDDFTEFFKIAMPKVLANLMMETDWFIDSERPIRIFEFERPSEDGNYTMLHLVMDIKRHEPPFEQRGPGARSAVAEQCYRQVVDQIFGNSSEVVSLKTIDEEEVQSNLDRILLRRNMYYPSRQEDQN